VYSGRDVDPPREDSHLPARHLPHLQEGHLPGLRQARRPGTRGSARVAAVQLRPRPDTPVRRPARVAATAVTRPHATNLTTRRRRAETVHGDPSFRPPGRAWASQPATQASLSRCREQNRRTHPTGTGPPCCSRTVARRRARGGRLAAPRDRTPVASVHRSHTALSCRV
jgi:hypothetical protein